MSLGIVLILAFMGFLIFFFMFHAPETDMVFSSSHEAEVIEAQRHLAAHGIKTYVKNREIRRFLGPPAYGNELENPSLHVLNASEYRRATRLIRLMERNPAP